MSAEAYTAPLSAHGARSHHDQHGTLHAATVTRGDAAAPEVCLHLHILGSGSKGNCALLEGPEGLIMIDCGFSRRETLARMHELGLEETDVRALLITHEHGDHTSGVPVWCRHFDGELYATTGTLQARKATAALAAHEFMPGTVLHIAGVTVETFPTSHDVINPVGFRFSCGEDAVGFVTDTGFVTPGALQLLSDVRILAMESNHDLPMLRTGDYPRYLQDRIASNEGHLSNAQAADAVRELVGKRTQELVAMHISQENNRPSLAVRALANALGATLDNELGSSATLVHDDGTHLHIRPAGQNRPISVW